MEFTYFGHACFSINFNQTKLLFDPFISGNPLAKNVDINNIQADFILVSHGHADHIADLLTIAKQTNATIIANAEITDWVVKQGYDKVHPMNFGVTTFPFGKVRMVTAVHSSGLPDGSYGGNPSGFIIEDNASSFYFAGDTALTLDMQLIPHYTKLNFAILPIGGNFTMDANDAVIAARFIECDTIIGVHYNTFGLIAIDTENAAKIFEKAGRKLLLPEIGETIHV